MILKQFNGVVGAIEAAYPKSRRQRIFNKLKKALRGRSVSEWNDNVTKRTVLKRMKELDI